jgi:hypothetical protein
MSVKTLARICGLGLALSLFCASAFAQATVVTQSGKTSVALSKSLLNALSSLGVTPGKISPSTLVKGVITFPITGGAFDADTAKGQIIHSGGLTLTAGGTQVDLESFIIDTTGSSPVLTGIAVVNGALVGRLTLFNLQLPSGITLPLQPVDGVLVDVNPVGVTLTSSAASTLNTVFGVTAFTGGFDIGNANLQAFIVPNY